MVAKQAVRTEYRPQGRSRRAALLGAASALLGAGTAHAAAPGALPQDPTVAGGAATFAQSGQTLTINQSTNRAVIDWRSFDIGAGAQTTFNQPGASAIAVNRINAGTDPTHIDGALRANGQVWILNPNGVMFGKGATVNVAGIVASTANIDAGRFMAGDNRLTFTGADRGFVTNDGAITVADNGLAAFVAPSVRNSGVINARVGKVSLAAGSTFTLDLAGDRLIEIGLGAGHAVVDQSGAIVDEGGVVTLSARSAGQVVDSVINMSGVVSTASARLAGGQIVLEGDTANVTGLADASGTSGGRISLAANTVSVGPQAVLRADSVANGDGGTITAMAGVQGDYAGTYSARGGPSGGNGGSVETSGKTVHIAGGISVDTRAPAGAMGSWTIDPDNLTIGASGAGTINGGVNSEDVTIGANTVVAALNTSSVILQANTSISVNAAIDSSAQTNSNSLTLKDENLDGHLTVNLNAPITLGLHQGLAGMANVVNLTDSGTIQNAIDVASTAGATVNVGAGNYDPGAVINKSNLVLLGTPGLSEIDVNPGSAQVAGLNIASFTSGVAIEGFTIKGEITGSYVDYVFGAGQSRGVQVANQATAFTISNNSLQNLRTGILVDGRDVSGATIANNFIDNTKSAVFLQYTAGSGISITGNSQGAFGNEWGENFHVNGFYDGVNLVAAPGGDAPTSVQTALLAGKAANGGWSVQDQGYATSNRTDVFVATNGSAANQGSPKAKLATIQAGVADVVTGGTVNVADGTYVIDSSVPYLGITKGLSLVGQSQAGTIIDAHAASQYGLRVTADNVSLSNFTLLGAWTPTGNSYGIKVENTVDSAGSIYNLSISNVTSHGARKAQLDMSGVVGATIDHFTADGTSNGNGAGSLAGAGIAITDSANVTITNSTTHDNAYSGLALYETNATRTQQVTGITVAANNNFNEPVPIYTERNSSTENFGTLSIAGFDYIVQSPTEAHFYFEKTRQAAIDLAALKGPTTATVQGYAGSNLTGNNVFTVGVGSNGAALSIQTAVNTALSGATINLLDGTYVIPGGGNWLEINKGLSLIGQSQTGTIINGSGASGYGMRVESGNVTLSNFTLLGATGSGSFGLKVQPVDGSSASSRIDNFKINNVTINGSNKSALDITAATNATIDHVTAENAFAGVGIAIVNSANVAVTNSTTLNNAWGGVRIEQKNSPYTQQTTAVSVDASNTLNEAVPLYLEDDSPGQDFGAITVGGLDYIVRAPNVSTDVYTWFQKTQQGAVNYATGLGLVSAYVEGWGGSAGNNIFTVGTGSNSAKLSLTTAYNAATSGATINVLNGVYTLPAQFNIAKSLSLIGAGVGNTTITSTSTGYGINVTADNVRLSGFTFNAPTVHNGATYGIKVTPDTNQAADRLLGFNIDHVAINGGWRTGLDLNGALGATIDNVSVSNVLNGNGIALTDSANVTITNTTTGNDAWGGLALYQTNTFYNQQINGIAVNATNSFNDVIPVYAEVQSTTQNIGSVSLAGFNYAVKSPNVANDVYTWFQKTQQGAIDFATNAALSNGNLNLSTATVQGYAGSGVAGNNIFTVGVSIGGQAMSIGAALNAAQTGAVVNVNNGTYVIPAGGTNYLDVSNSLTLTGQSQAGVIIDARGATAYGLRVQADNVTLSNFTLLGSQQTGGYGVKVEPLNLSDPNSRINSFAINHVTIDGATKNTLDLNGAHIATIDNITAKNAVAGNGIALIDSSNVTITNSTTANNAWGGLRIEEKNASFNQQTNAVTVAASNSFTEASPVYLEDDSASQNFGTVNVAGFSYAVKSPTNPADVFTWFQKTQQGAIDFAAAQALSTATVQNYSGSGFGDNIYTVGFSTGGQALSIQAAANAVQAGGTINIGAGTYAQNVTDSVRANFNFSGSTLGGFTLASGASGSGLSGALTANAITLNAPVILLGSLTLNTSAAGGAITTGAIDGGQSLTLNAGSGQVSLGALGSGTRLGALQVSAGRTNLGGSLTAASIALNGPATLLTGLTLDTSAAGGAITAGAIDGGQTLALNAGSGQVSLGALGSVMGLGALQVAAGRTNLGGNLTAASIALNGPATLLTGLTLDTSAAGGAITTGAIDGGQSLTLNAGAGQVSLGALGSATGLGALQVSAGRTNLGGNLTAASITLNGPATLLTGLTLDTSAAGGAITTGAIDASNAGGQALALNAGGGSITLGSLGASARLGAVQTTSSTTLTGDTYNAASLAFGGDVVLTAGQTTVNTAPVAGNITVSGSLLGSSDGAQSLVLAAGSGAGGANGDISLQNVGAKAVRLNNLTVSGGNFGAQTVDIAGDFTAKLTGNQVFSSHTLNAGGQVNSTVGGNASGPINGGQSVTFAVAGDLTGAIQGTDVALNAGTLTGATVTASQSANVTADSVVGSSVAANQNLTVAANSVSGSSLNSSKTTNISTGSMTGSTVGGSQNLTVAATTVSGSNLNSNQSVNLSAGTVSGATVTAPTVTATANSFSGNVTASSSAAIGGGDISGSFSGGSFKIAGTGTVSANVTATSVSVDAAKGTVTGSWQSLDTGSSGRGVSVNNQPVNVQGSGISANQIVVENFTLPTGSVVTKTGEIVLPQGLMIGLLSPGGASGAPKLIQVQTVQQLGSLLSEGYTAIVIDLSGHEKASNDDKAVKVSQN